jgi:hypothetical protein
METNTQHPSTLGSAWNGLPGVATVTDALDDGVLQSDAGAVVTGERRHPSSRPVATVASSTALEISMTI